MDPLLAVSAALKRVRFERSLTLEEASGITGVSKAMLGQIERGESNPTISILWKISSGLKIPFSELLGKEENAYESIDVESLTPIYESDGNMILYDVFPFNPLTGFEYFYIRLRPGGNHKSTPHLNGSIEHVVVTQGTLIIEVEEQTFSLKAPSALKFKADAEHTYRNISEEDAIFQSIVKY